MKKSKEQRIRDSVKLSYVLFATECSQCESLVKREKMFHVYVRGIRSGTIMHLHFCEDCVQSVDDVLQLPQVKGRFFLFDT